MSSLGKYGVSYISSVRPTMKVFAHAAAGRRLGVGLAAPLLLAACSRQQAPPSVEKLPPTVAEVSGSPVAAGAPMDAEKVLNVFNWSDYIDPSIVPGFEKEY